MSDSTDDDLGEAGPAPCVVRKNNMEATYHRVYPTKVTLDLKWKMDEMREAIGSNSIFDVMGAANSMRDREIAYVQDTFGKVETEFTEQLPREGDIVWVGDINVTDEPPQRDFTLNRDSLIVHASGNTFATDAPCEEGISDAFLAGQLMTAARRSYVQLFHEMYDKGLTRAILEQWLRAQ